MIRRIRIRNYKSLGDIDLKLQPLTVLLGPNAAGKSNFMDALQLLSRLVQSRSLKEAFDPPYRGKPLESFAFDGEGLAGLLAREEAAFTFEVDVELSNAVVEVVNREVGETKVGPVAHVSNKTLVGNGHSPRQGNFVTNTRLRYRLEVGIKPRTGSLFVVDEFLAVLGKDGQPRTERPKPFLERKGDRLHLRMEGQSHPTYYERFLDHTILSRPHYPPHHPHMHALKREMERWFFYYFEPRERMRALNSVKEIRHIGMMGEELAAYLHTMKAKDPRQFQAVEKAIHTLIPSITGIRTEVNKLGEVELGVSEHGVDIPARVLSEGTLRALGLLALSGVKDPPSLIGFEEPENGVHPRRISAIAQLLATRASSGTTQLVITTHSPILADNLPPECLFVCKKQNRGTQIQPISSWGSLSHRSSIGDGLEDSEIPALTTSERLLRGDFDD